MLKQIIPEPVYMFVSMEVNVKRHSSILILLVLALLGAGTFVWSQGEESPLPPPEQQPEAQPAPRQVWSADQLDNLVAPVALYPDPLLGQMLVASTYPLEIVEANQWLQQNRNLSGKELMDAARQQSWDPSVQALVAVPDALAKLNQDVRWTTDLGNAFLAQEAEVMNAVQRMRARARSNGRLHSTPQQIVTTEEQGPQQVIVIQPAEPQVIYVPAYDPFYVWGPPVYGYYPPLYYSGFGFGFGRGFNLGFCFDSWGGWGGWGWGPSWYGHSVFVNNFFFHRFGFHRGFGGGFRGRTIWAHDPGHRHGIPYGNHQVAARFRGASFAPRNSFRAGAGPRVAGAPYANHFAGRTREQGYRNTAPHQYRSSPQQYRTAPQTQRYQSQAQPRFRAQQQYRSAPQQYRAAPQALRYQSQALPRYQAQQQFRASPQSYRSAPQQFRSAPRMSAPRFSGGSSFGGGGFRSGGGNSGRGGDFRSGHGSGGSSGGGHRRP